MGYVIETYGTKKVGNNLATYSEVERTRTGSKKNNEYKKVIAESNKKASSSKESNKIASEQQPSKKSSKKKKYKGILSKKLVGVPKATLIEKRNLLNELKKSKGYKVVREVEKHELVRDDRSLYFNEEFKREKDKFLF